MFDDKIEIPKEKEQAIKTDLLELEKIAAGLIVKTDEQMVEASRFLAQVKMRINRLKDIKDELVKPMKDAVKHADNWFKMQVEPFLTLESQVKGSLAVYIVAKERAAAKEAKQTGEIIERLKAKVNTEFGQVSSTKRWAWRVMDESKVAREYLTVDNAKVTLAVRNGERTLSGIEIFQETSVRVS